MKCRASIPDTIEFIKSCAVEWCVDHYWHWAGYQAPGADLEVYRKSNQINRSVLEHSEWIIWTYCT